MKKYLWLLLLLIPFSVLARGYKVVDGDLNTVGSRVKIGNEYFYVIGKEDDTHIKLLSACTLNVGNNINLRQGEPGMQACGYSYDRYPVAFADTNYWHNGSQMSGRAKDEYGGYAVNQNEPWLYMDDSSNTVFPYVYTNKKENGSYVNNLAEHVENYVSMLKDFHVGVTGRLLSVEELVELGCSTSSESCSNAPSYIQSSAYWTGTAADGTSLWTVSGNYLTSYAGETSYNYDVSDAFGIKPVIILDTNYVDGNPNRTTKAKIEVVSGDINTVGSIIKIANEEFYVIGDEDERHVKLFSKYNLRLGDGTLNTIRQDEESTDLVNFSDSAYWWSNNSLLDRYGPTKITNALYNERTAYVYDNNASISNYVNAYVDYLNTQGVRVTGRLIDNSEQIDLDCEQVCVFCQHYSVNCTSTMFPWVHSTNYWTGSAIIWSEYNSDEQSHSLYMGRNEGNNGATFMTFIAFPNQALAGVRPVIILDLDYIESQGIVETVKGTIEEIKENPKTGVFGYTLYILIFALLAFAIYKKTSKKSYFK